MDQDCTCTIFNGWIKIVPVACSNNCDSVIAASDPEPVVVVISYLGTRQCVSHVINYSNHNPPITFVKKQQASKKFTSTKDLAQELFTVASLIEA